MYAANALWQFARPRTLVLLFLHIALGYVYLVASTPEWYQVILAAVAITAAYISAASFNDISDQEVDVLNLPRVRQANDRPLINKTLSLQTAWQIAAVSSAVCIVSCFLLQPWLGSIGIAVICMNIMYSLPPVRISKRGALAQAVLPLMYVGFPLCIAAAMAHKAVSLHYWWLAGALYCIFMGRLFLKDIRDEKGDQKTNKRTYLVRHGLRANNLQAGFWMIVGMIFLTINLMTVYKQLPVLVPINTLAAIGVVTSLYFCYKTRVLEQKLLWVGMAGRFGSLVASCAFIYIVLGQSSANEIAKNGLLLLTAGIFFMGVGMLYEELQANTSHKNNI